VTHAYGAEAGQIAHRANHAVRNVGLVYIDARGVTRRAILKSVGKAAVRGRMNDGREVILGSDETVDQWTLVSKEPDISTDHKHSDSNHTAEKDHKF
jgi:spartin